MRLRSGAVLGTAWGWSGFFVGDYPWRGVPRVSQAVVGRHSGPLSAVGRARIYPAARRVAVRVRL